MISHKRSYTSNRIHPSSFRDPCGFLFSQGGVYYRQVNAVYKEEYDHLLSSGLYNSLNDAGLLIAHEEVMGSDPHAYKMLKPEQLFFVSYPYEWAFSQLKDAALATLRIQKMAIDHGMSLKDASAHNIQYMRCKPLFIDSLSFEKYKEGTPWVAYRQFCQHFLAPLALMSYKDIRLAQLARVYLDGIPLDLASVLLPFRGKIVFSLFLHICLHAKSQKHYAGKQIEIKDHHGSRHSFKGHIDNLESAVKKLKWQPNGTEWSGYYEETNYSPAASEQKSVL